jgi:hypothetical protein
MPKAKAFRAFSAQGNVGQPFATEWHAKDKVLGPMGMNCGMRDQSIHTPKYPIAYG